jgi:DNA-directed RNA polymerase alpha subunit
MPGRSQSKDADLVIRSGLPNWLIKVLRQNGVRRLSRLQGMSDKELLKIPGVGARSIEMIRHVLNSLQYTPDETMH